MPRYCLLGHVDPDRLDEYRGSSSGGLARPAAGTTRRGMAQLLLFLREDGLLIGYAEADDLALAQRTWPGPRSTHAGRRPWPNCSSRRGPDEAWELIPEVFNLEEQLAASSKGTSPPS